jgi:multiple sugar transport system permease protein
MVPLVFMVTTSFKLPVEIRSSGALWPQDGVTTVNWTRAYRNVPVFRFLFNSTVVAVSSAALAVAFGLPLAYVIVRFRLGGRLLPAWVLGAYVAPPIVFAIPVSIIVKSGHLIDSKVGLTVVHAAASLPVTVWLLESFVRRVPRELDEAAWLEGAGYLSTLWRVTVPVLRPGIVGTFIIAVVLSWTEFLFALVLTFSERAQTFPIGIANFIGEHGQQFGEMSAAALGGLIPVYVLALLFQRFLIKGLSEGAIAG